jgi:hypothetical protein
VNHVVVVQVAKSRAKLIRVRCHQDS